MHFFHHVYSVLQWFNVCWYFLMGVSTALDTLGSQGRYGPKISRYLLLTVRTVRQPKVLLRSVQHTERAIQMLSLHVVYQPLLFCPCYAFP